MGLGGRTGARAAQDIKHGSRRIASAGPGNISLVARSHLFGVAPVAEGPHVGASAETPTTFKLTGTVSREHDPHQGYAIVGLGDGVAQLVSAGASLPGGWQLLLVFPDRVILERSGAQIEVALPQRYQGAARRREPVFVARTDSEDDAVVPSEDPRHHFWLAGLRARPLTWGTQVRGYRLAPPKAIAQRLGLRPGDVATSLNGVSLDSDAAVEKQLQNLGDTVSMTILRGGTVQTVRFRLDEQDLEAGAVP